MDYNTVTKRPTSDEMIHYSIPKSEYHGKAAAISRASQYLTELDGIDMLELEDQRRRGMIERQEEDVIKQIASSSNKAAQALRGMRPPLHRAQQLNICDTHGSIGNHFKLTKMQYNIWEKS